MKPITQAENYPFPYVVVQASPVSWWVRRFPPDGHPSKQLPRKLYIRLRRKACEPFSFTETTPVATTILSL